MKVERRALTCPVTCRSGTLRLHKSDVSIYNLNIANTYGHPVSQSQALALSAYGGRLGFYGCSFSGYQDTIFTTNGTCVQTRHVEPLARG